MKSAVSGPIQVYSQNGSGTKYNIGTTTVQATTEYKRYSVTVTPQLQTGTTMTQALLAFYGVYDSGRIPTIKNVKVELGKMLLRIHLRLVRIIVQHIQNTKDSIQIRM